MSLPHPYLSPREPAFRPVKRARKPHAPKPAVIAAILYHRNTHTHRFGPHSVFTCQWIRFYDGTEGWSFSEHDFEYCHRDGQYLHHESGGGSSPYLNQLCAATRYLADPEKAAWRQRGLLNDSAVWWNPSICQIRLNSCRKDLALHPRMAADMGWRVLPQPAVLCPISRSRDPFSFSLGGYETNEESAIYCQHCDDWLPSDSDEPCEHLVWREGGDGYHDRLTGKPA